MSTDTRLSLNASVGRRTFLKASAVVGATAAVGAAGVQEARATDDVPAPRAAIADLNP